MTEQQARAKAEELIRSGKPFVMATVDENCQPWMRWMGALAPDPEQPNAYYMVCGRHSRKMGQLTNNANTQLMFSTDDFSCVVTLNGRSEIVDCSETKRRVWDMIPGASKYFESPESPDFGVIRFQAQCMEVLCIQETHEPVRITLCG